MKKRVRLAVQWGRFALIVIAVFVIASAPLAADKKKAGRDNKADPPQTVPPNSDAALNPVGAPSSPGRGFIEGIIGIAPPNIPIAGPGTPNDLPDGGFALPDPIALPDYNTTDGELGAENLGLANVLRIAEWHNSANQVLADAPALQEYVESALSRLEPLDTEREKIYRPILRASLAKVAARIKHLDKTPDGDLLIQVGEAIADQLDEVVHAAVWNEAFNGRPASEHVNYGELMENINRDDNGLLYLAGKYPGFMRLLETRSEQLTEMFDETARRFDGDKQALAAKFANDYPVNGLTGIRLTDSDPHKNGRRVLILTMHTDDGDVPVVYKPRDIRVDERLVGADGHTLANFVSDALLANGVADNSLPTYRFLPATDGDDHYGYVEFLTTGEDEDNLFTPDQAAQFYRDFGRQLAMLALAGARDLHQTNLMVSGRQPYFTDLELSFQSQVLEVLSDPQVEGAREENILVPQMMDGTNIFKSTQTGLRIPGQVQDGLYQHQDRQVTEKVDNNLVRVQTDSGEASNHDDPRIQAQYADDVRQGFVEVIDALANAAADDQMNADFDLLIDGFRDSQIRYHPVATTRQLGILNAQLLFIDRPTETADAKLESIAAGLSEFPAEVRRHFADDWKRGDVAYFARVLGENQLLHDGKTDVPGQADYFGDDPLATVIENFKRLAPESPNQESRLATFMKQQAEDYSDALKPRTVEPTPSKSGFWGFVRAVRRAFQ